MSKIALAILILAATGCSGLRHKSDSCGANESFTRTRVDLGSVDVKSPVLQAAANVLNVEPVVLASDLSAQHILVNNLSVACCRMLRDGLITLSSYDSLMVLALRPLAPYDAAVDRAREQGLLSENVDHTTAAETGKRAGVEGTEEIEREQNEARTDPSRAYRDRDMDYIGLTWLGSVNRLNLGGSRGIRTVYVPIVRSWTGGTDSEGTHGEDSRGADSNGERDGTASGLGSEDHVGQEPTDRLANALEQIESRLESLEGVVADTLQAIAVGAVQAEHVVFFEFGDDGTDGETVEALREFVERYAPPYYTFSVVGYADGQGSDPFNLGLASRRADTVRRVLIDATGVSPRRIAVGAVGSTGRFGSSAATNRRVVVQVHGPR